MSVTRPHSFSASAITAVRRLSPWMAPAPNRKQAEPPGFAYLDIWTTWPQPNACSQVWLTDVGLIGSPIGTPWRWARPWNTPFAASDTMPVVSTAIIIGMEKRGGTIPAIRGCPRATCPRTRRWLSTTLLRVWSARSHRVLPAPYQVRGRSHLWWPLPRTTATAELWTTTCFRKRLRSALRPRPPGGQRWTVSSSLWPREMGRQEAGAVRWFLPVSALPWGQPSPPPEVVQTSSRTSQQTGQARPFCSSLRSSQLSRLKLTQIYAHWVNLIHRYWLLYSPNLPHYYSHDTFQLYIYIWSTYICKYIYYVYSHWVNLIYCHYTWLIYI